MNRLFDRLRRHRIATAIVAISATAPIFLSLTQSVSTAASPSTARIVFFDVGQGDATLVDGGGGKQALVDGGPDAAVLSRLGRYMPFGDREIELLVLTHPHADHVGGLVDTLRRYEVGRVLMTGVVPESPAAIEFEREVVAQGIPVSYAVAGDGFEVGAIRLETLWPEEPLAGVRVEDGGSAATGGMNDTSIVLRASAASSSALLLGDVSEDVERRLVGKGLDLRADVLKAGHHGSGRSNSREFVAAVMPRFAVVSAGLRNRYGLPALKAVMRLEGSGAELLRTDRDGDVVLTFGPAGVEAAVSGK